MKIRIRINNLCYIGSFIVLMMLLLFPFASCDKKIEVPQENNSDSLIIIKKEETIKPKEPLYSFPPNVISSDISNYTKEEIDKMAKELKMKALLYVTHCIC